LIIIVFFCETNCSYSYYWFSRLWGLVLWGLTWFTEIAHRQKTWFWGLTLMQVFWGLKLLQLVWGLILLQLVWALKLLHLVWGLLLLQLVWGLTLMQAVKAARALVGKVSAYWIILSYKKPNAQTLTHSSRRNMILLGANTYDIT
jgi:hypothetical protein